MIETKQSNTNTKPHARRINKMRPPRMPEPHEDQALKEFQKVSGFNFTVKKFWIDRFKEKGAKGYVPIRPKDNAGINTPIAFAHFTHRHNIMLPIFPQSKYVIFKIDENKRAYDGFTIPWVTDYIVERLGKPDYVEFSEEKKIAHLYYKFEDWVSPKSLMEFKSKADSEKYTFKIRYHTDNFVLPLSHTFKGGTFSHIMPDKIYFEKEINNIEELSQHFKEMYSKKGYKLPKGWDAEHKQGMELRKKSTIGNGSSAGFKYLSYNFGYGTRYDNVMKISLLAQRLDWSFEQFYTECRSMNDGTSKDMAKSENTVRRTLQKVYDKGQSFKDPSWSMDIRTFEKMPESYKVFNDYNLTNFQKSTLEKAFSKMLSKYEIEYGIKAEELSSHAVVYYQELARKREDDKSRNRKYDNLDTEWADKLNQGFIFPRQLRRKAAQALGIKYVDIIHTIFLKEKVLNPIQVCNDGFWCEYSYKGKVRFAKHYTLENPANIYLGEFHKLKVLFPEGFDEEHYASFINSKEDKKTAEHLCEFHRVNNALFENTFSATETTLEKFCLFLNTLINTYNNSINTSNRYLYISYHSNINYVATDCLCCSLSPLEQASRGGGFLGFP